MDISLKDDMTVRDQPFENTEVVLMLIIDHLVFNIQIDPGFDVENNQFFRSDGIIRR